MFSDLAFPVCSVLQTHFTPEIRTAVEFRALQMNCGNLSKPKWPFPVTSVY